MAVCALLPSSAGQMLANKPVVNIQKYMDVEQIVYNNTPALHPNDTHIIHTVSPSVWHAVHVQHCLYSCTRLIKMDFGEYDVSRGGGEPSDERRQAFGSKANGWCK